MKPTAAEFVQAVRGPLEAGDAEALVREVDRRWTASEVSGLLGASDGCVRGAVAVVLGMIGTTSQLGVLSRALHDEDASVRQMAEHALWSVWLRCGADAALGPMHDGIKALAEDRVPAAIDHLEEALRRDPEFAEAYHQLGIALSSQERWAEAAEAFCAASTRLPSHFAAWAGLGHCCCQLGRWERALCAYRKAMSIHPRLADLPEAIERVRARVVETPTVAAWHRAGEG
ncbi:MAG: tetratricopeptide repeat protein [Planctomycetota bacterium]